MENNDKQNNPQADPALEQLDKALRLLEYYNRTDIGPLRARLANTIKKSIRRRRLRMVVGFAVASAAVAAMFLIAVLPHKNREGVVTSDRITLVVDDLKLIMPDGKEIIIDRGLSDSPLAAQNGMAIMLERGGLKINSLEGDIQTVSEPAYGVLKVPRGMKFELVLSDGTRVWLNADSELRFPARFTPDERLVYLKGEGYFDVSPNVESPFKVETGEQTLTVTGTSFNIYAYPGESVIQTTVVSGSVSLNCGEQEIMLFPGSQAQLPAGSGNFSVRSIDLSDVTAWVNDIFLFDGNTLEEVFLKLSRWYDFEYEFNNETTASFQLKGEIPVYDDIERVLKLIESSGRVNILNQSKKIYIAGK